MSYTDFDAFCAFIEDAFGSEGTEMPIDRTMLWDAVCDELRPFASQAVQPWLHAALYATEDAPAIEERARLFRLVGMLITRHAQAQGAAAREKPMHGKRGQIFMRHVEVYDDCMAFYVAERVVDNERQPPAVFDTVALGTMANVGARFRDSNSWTRFEAIEWDADKLVARYEGKLARVYKWIGPKIDWNQK